MWLPPIEQNIVKFLKTTTEKKLFIIKCENNNKWLFFKRLSEQKILAVKSPWIFFIRFFFKIFQKKNLEMLDSPAQTSAPTMEASVSEESPERDDAVKKQTKKQEHICISFHFICWFWFLEMFFWWSFVNISDCLSVLWMLTLIFEVKWWCFDWNELVLS